MDAGARRMGLLLVVLAGLVLGGASLAWACTPNAYIYLSPNQGEAGDQTTVTGDNFIEGGNVEIRWDGSDGEILAETTGSEFREEVTVPDVSADTYTIVAVGYDRTGEVAGKGAANYDVRASSSPDNETDESGDSQGTESVSGGSDEETSDSEGSTTESSGSQETSGQTQTTASGADGETDDSERAESSESSESTMSPDPSQDSTQSESLQPDSTQQPEPESEPQAEPQPEPESQAEPEPQSHAEPAPEPQSQPEPQPEPEPRQQGQASGTQSAPEPTLSEASAPRSEAGESPETGETSDEPESSMDDVPVGRSPEAWSTDEVRAPSARTGSRDLWNGLSGGDEVASGLESSATEFGNRAGADPSRLLAMGAGLVGTGLVLLMGAVLITAVRRRPAPRHAHRPVAETS